MKLIHEKEKETERMKLDTNISYLDEKFRKKNIIIHFHNNNIQ